MNRELVYDIKIGKHYVKCHEITQNSIRNNKSFWHDVKYPQQQLNFVLNQLIIRNVFYTVRSF